VARPLQEVGNTALACVSTGRQGRSGLGLEAQRAAIARFAEAEGLTVVAEFIEVESGKGADALELRQQLAAALDKARSAGVPSSWPSLTGSRATFTSSAG
jgi:DNA invertase Pin-like site-specific DNA recombinase